WRVAQHRPCTEMRGRDAVDAADNADALAQRDDRGGIGADIAEVRAAQRQKPAVGVKRELSLAHEVAALVIAEERLGALAGPLDRSADFAGGPDQQGEFRKQRILRAEIAPDVIGDDAHRLERHVEDARDLSLLPYHPTTAGIEDVAFVCRVENADGRTR